MKLYLVDWRGYSEEGAKLFVVETPKQAEEMCAKWLGYCCYYCDALEVTNVDGYKVSIEKEEE